MRYCGIIKKKRNLGMGLRAHFLSVGKSYWTTEIHIYKLNWDSLYVQNGNAWDIMCFYNRADNYSYKEYQVFFSN